MPRTAHVLSAALALASLAGAGSAVAAGSRVTSLSVQGRQALDGGYERVHGIALGVVSGTEHVRGLPAAGLRYAVQYEVIRPTGKPKPRLLLLEAENRGSPVVLNALNSGTGASGPPASATYPRSASRFLRSERLAYARVQWQTGIAADVPATAQGTGEVIVRDFARYLGSRYSHRALVGDSQGAFFADTFLAEGWNAAPRGGRAFTDALTIDGNGNWMAINDYAGKGAENPYLRANGRPFSYRRMLRRPRTDPRLVDVANYTDFYRLRAGLTDGVAPPAGVHRYDWASPHQSFGPSLVFGALHCNGGVAIPLNPLRNQPYLRALVHGMARGRLPASRRFALGPHPRTSAAFNGLAGAVVPVPRTDPLSQPVGGVRFPELGEPLGRLKPVSISPAVTTSSGAVCGNSGGFTPFSAATVGRRSSRAGYLARYGRAVTRLEHAGYVRAADRARMLAAARADYAGAVR